VYGSGRARDTVSFTPNLDDDFAEAFLESADLARAHNAEHGAGSVRVRDIEFYLANIVTRKRHHMCFRTPCGAGTSHIAFDVHGNYFACDEMVGRNEFRIGNIYEDDNLASALSRSTVSETLKNRTVQSIPKCRRCPIKFICGGGCASRIHAKFGTIHKESHFCRFQEVSIEGLMWKIDRDPQFVGLIMGPTLRSDEIMANQYKL